MGENTNNTQQQNENGTQQQGEKLFTQDDVNRIIGERLARVKTDMAPDLQERESVLNQRELMLDAREKLADAGLPKELLSALNCSSKKDMENSIKTLQTFFGNTAAAEPPKTSGYRIVTSTNATSNGSGKGRSSADDPGAIRKAMGLKG